VSVHLVVAFCTSGSELRAAAELLGLRDPRQIDRVQGLGKGECIVSLTGDRCPVPLLIRIPLLEVNRSNLSREEREFFVTRSLEDQLPHVLPRFTGYIQEREDTERRERDPNRLSYAAWKAFTMIAEYPYETIEERCAALDMNRAEEETARKECLLKGYVCEAGSIGRGITFFQLTPKGLALAQQHYVRVHTFKSSVVHEALLRRVMRGISMAAPNTRWTKPQGATGSVQPDGYGLLSGGRAICVQINCQNKHDYEIRRLMDLCAIEHVDLALLVVPTKKAAASVSLIIDKMWKPEVPRRYVILSATECLEPDFDWVTLLERPC
jgi:hypothetical protein